jgi:hypothetical protein
MAQNATSVHASFDDLEPPSLGVHPARNTLRQRARNQMVSLNEVLAAGAIVNG